MPIPASSPRNPPRSWPSGWSATSPAGSPTSISSAADRKRSRPRSRSRGNISSSAASRSARTSSRAARAITATRSARSSAGGNAWRREPYAPLLSDAFSHVTPAFAYHEKRDDESEAAFMARLAAELEAEFQRLGPDTVAAFIAEPVVGATAGCVAAPEGYFRAVREICDRHGALLDPRRSDVRHGPHRHAACLGAGRRQPRHPGDRQGAGRRLPADRRDARDAQASSTPSATAPARSSMATPISAIRSPAPPRSKCRQIIREEKLLDRVKERGEQLEQRLTERFGNHRHVGDIRGRGLFRAIELVADRATRTPFDPATEAASPRSRPPRSSAGSPAIRRAARWTAGSATMCCWRRPISQHATRST